MQNEHRIRVLLIEDNLKDVHFFRELLSEAKKVFIEMDHADRLSSALAFLAKQNVDVILSDLGLPDSHGLDTFLALHTHYPDTPVIVLTGRDDEAFATEAVRKGAQDYLVKGSVDSGLLIKTMLYSIERQKMLTELNHNEERFRSLTNVAGDAIISTDSLGNITLWNKAAKHIFGYTSEEVMGKPALMIIPDRFQKTHSEGMRRIVSTGESRIAGKTVETAGRKKDGSEFPLELSVATWKENEETFFVAIIRDITERTRAAAELRKLSWAVEQSPASVVITDSEGNIEYVNKKFTQVTGYNVEEVIGQNPRILKSGERTSAEYKELWETITSGGEWHGEFHNKKRNGELFWEYASIIAIRNEEGQITNFLAVKEEITERKKIEEQLQATKEAAEAANKAKSHFLARMSHELRTPLNSVIGFANILLKNKNGNLFVKDIEYLKIILINAKHLLGLINDILDLSKIEAGKEEVHLSSVSMDMFVQDIINQISGQIGDREIDMCLELPESVAPFETDEAKLKQVLINLVGNAIKFTSRGSIKVRVEIDENTRLPVRIDVTDTGIGIPKDKLEVIFKPFQQVDYAASRKYGGTGLGLAISRRLLKLLGYSLEVKSEVGEGSTFSVLLTHKPGPLPRDPLKVGGHTKMDGTAYYLDSLSEKICALEAAGKVLARNRPEAVGDIRRLAHSLKGSGGTFGFPEITAAAAALEESVEETLFEYLESLIETVRNVASHATETKARPFVAYAHGAASGHPPAPVPSPETRKILLIDDDPDTLLIASMALRKVGGFNVITARDGGEALARAKSERPDGIITDFMMPDMDGQGLLELVRSSEETRKIPVIFLTAVSMPSDISRLISLGAKGVISKPFDPMELSEEVKRMLGV